MSQNDQAMNQTAGQANAQCIRIKNGRVIDPANGIDEIGDLTIVDGKIVGTPTETAENFRDLPFDEEIDATGKVVCPGLVDLRMRLRDPGHDHKGTFQSETCAAAAGGVTTVCLPPDTKPILDSSAAIKLVRHKEEHEGNAHIAILGALTHRLRCEQLSKMGTLKQAGCVGFSNADVPVESSLLMRHAMEYAANYDMPVFLRPQDPWLVNNGCAHEGTVSTRLGLPGIPESAETAGIARDLVLIRETGVSAHFCGLSSLHGLQMVEQARQEGLPVTADVAAHQLHLTEMDIGHFNSQCHVIPPLRTERDMQGLRQGVVSGAVQAVCSDHQPHEEDAKNAPFEQTEPGISSVETLLPLTLRLMENDLLFSLSDALERLTVAPAKILGIDAGTLSVGKAADVCIFDPDVWWTVQAEALQSAGKNSPFIGWEMKGKVVRTLLSGRTVFRQD